jgi:two-component system, NarL family, nitrate/nitrite response regulator NarL
MDSNHRYPAEFFWLPRRLGISQHTVKFHVESLFRKLGAVTRADAVRKGLRQRLFEI